MSDGAGMSGYQIKKEKSKVPMLAGWPRQLSALAGRPVSGAHDCEPGKLMLGQSSIHD